MRQSEREWLVQVENVSIKSSEGLMTWRELNDKMWGDKELYN